MQIETSKIRDGEMIGEIVWICHYNRPDLDKKPLRNVPPTKVLVRSNDELPKNKRVYYSGTHFSPIGKSGKATAKVISPVDNTGYRSLCGNELFVFTTEEECIEEWNKQIDECGLRLDERIANATKYWSDQKIALIESKIV